MADRADTGAREPRWLRKLKRAAAEDFDTAELSAADCREALAVLVTDSALLQRAQEMRERAERWSSLPGVSSGSAISQISRDVIALLDALEATSATHRHGYTCEQAEREIDAQMTAKLEAQQCLRLICGALDLRLDQLADGWQASLPIIFARIETITDEADRAFRERDAALAAGVGVPPDAAEPERQLDALDRAAYYYRRELKEILADCDHDRPSIAKIRERAEAAIRAADHELAGVGVPPPQDEVANLVVALNMARDALKAVAQQGSEERDRVTAQDALDRIAAFSDSLAGVGEARPAPEYPHKDGDFLILGPQIFTDAEGSAIAWRGEIYVRGEARPEPRCHRCGGKLPLEGEDYDVRVTDYCCAKCAVEVVAGEARPTEPPETSA